jgi:hypothetical protein
MRVFSKIESKNLISGSTQLDYNPIFAQVELRTCVFSIELSSKIQYQLKYNLIYAIGVILNFFFCVTLVSLQK